MMDIETVTRTIQLILAPVVMVTACAITLTGLLARYAAINERLQAMVRERLDLLTARGAAETVDSLSGERLTQIDAQIPLLLRHHKQAHDSVLFVYYAVAVYVADMFVIAIVAATGAAWASGAVLILFLAGTGLLFVGILLMAIEVRTSHQALHDEVQRVAGLGRK
jgi:hypothetical protein